MSPASLSDRAHRIARRTHAAVERADERLATRLDRVRSAPARRLDSALTGVAVAGDRLRRRAPQLVAAEQRHLDALAARLALLDPVNLLRRGLEHHAHRRRRGRALRRSGHRRRHDRHSLRRRRGRQHRHDSTPNTRTHRDDHRHAASPATPKHSPSSTRSCASSTAPTSTSTGWPNGSLARPS